MISFHILKLIIYTYHVDILTGRRQKRRIYIHLSQPVGRINYCKTIDLEIVENSYKPRCWLNDFFLPHPRVYDIYD